MPLRAGLLLERGCQREVPPLKRRHFAVIGSNNVKTVADRYIGLLNCCLPEQAFMTSFPGVVTAMILNYLETPK